MNFKYDKMPFICQRIDAFTVGLGNTVCWLNVFLVLVILVQVTLRYVAGISVVALEELQWHLYGLLIMFGLSFNLTTDRHIRLDLVHRKLSPRKKEIIEFWGILFLLLPMVIIFFYHGLDFAAGSYRVGETSGSPLGLPCRWLIKGIIPLSMVLLGMAAVSRLIRAAAFLFYNRKDNG